MNCPYCETTIICKELIESEFTKCINFNCSCNKMNISYILDKYQYKELQEIHKDNLINYILKEFFYRYTKKIYDKDEITMLLLSYDDKNFNEKYMLMRFSGEELYEFKDIIESNDKFIEIMTLDQLRFFDIRNSHKYLKNMNNMLTNKYFFEISRRTFKDTLKGEHLNF